MWWIAVLMVVYVILSLYVIWDLLGEVEHAKDELKEAKDNLEDTHRVLWRCELLLRGTANALKGEPPELTNHSHHDLPEVAAALKAENAQLKKKLDRQE